jgi:hypothetical protein
MRLWEQYKKKNVPFVIYLSDESSELCRDNLWPGSHWYKRWYDSFARPIAITHDRNRRHDEDLESCEDSGHNECD